MQKLKEIHWDSSCELTPIQSRERRSTVAAHARTSVRVYMCV